MTETVRTQSRACEARGRHPIGRHAQPSRPMAVAVSPADGPDRLDFEGLSIDRSAREVTVGWRVVELTRLEFDLLAHLATAPRRVFSRGQLLHDVWHSSSDWQTSKTVTEHVRRIRQKIESNPGRPRWVCTVSGAGYRFEP